MKYGKLAKSETGKTIIDKVLITENWLERARGLLGRDQLQAGEAMLISPCNSVHTFFMSYTIDVVYLDKNLKIVKICPELGPWQLSGCSSAAMVLELPAQTANNLNLQVGTQISWQQKK